MEKIREFQILEMYDDDAREYTLQEAIEELKQRMDVGNEVLEIEKEGDGLLRVKETAFYLREIEEE